MTTFFIVIGFFILMVILAFRSHKTSNPYPAKSFSRTAFLRATIIALGAAVPLLVLYLFISIYLPGNNFNPWGPPKPPTTSFYISSIILGLCFILMDFLIGRRYYRSIQRPKQTK